MLPNFFRYITMEEYPYKFFPEYCLGDMYVAIPSTIATLRDESNNVPFFWVDDIFTTGIVAREAGITFEDLPISVDRLDYGHFYEGK
ncbi:hypothetical protein NECAME_06977 [Necator americanus]|uniref:Hexosyltransferase n=1 Tax=Necator americanus TaxID=51031 RepID=W2TR23_NECAM|nr:hypothetical protein NECAME_06977 [Necator americanus]ETN84233.1 hypothetical protein NECAME_06977 [Necator americanus]